MLAVDPKPGSLGDVSGDFPIEEAALKDWKPLQ